MEEKQSPPPIDRLALLFVVGLFAITAALFVVEPPESNVSVLNLIVGAILGIVGTIAAYRWGSSEGSKTKQDAMIAELSPRRPDVS